MLIQLADQYVNTDHIVEIVAHPVARDVCVLLTTSREIRVPMGNMEDKMFAVARVARLIKEKSNVTA